MASGDSQSQDNDNVNKLNASTKNYSNNATSTTSSTNIAKQKFPYHIGGPNTSLPYFAESFLGWSLCLSCLAVSGYHYGKSILLSSGWYSKIYRRARGLLRGMIVGVRSSPPSITQHNRPNDSQSNYRNENLETTTWIPLTTHSRAELDDHSPWKRYLSLVRVLEKCHPEVLTPLLVPVNKAESCSSITASGADNDVQYLKCKADAALIRVLRHDGICRRLASLAMRPYDATRFRDGVSNTHVTTATAIATATTLLQQMPHNRLLQRMSKLWNYFLILPSLEEAKSFYRLPNPSVCPLAVTRNKTHAKDVNYPYRISLIVPAYHEKGTHLLNKLTRALEMAEDPNEVEVVVVDAGGCSDLELLQSLATGDDDMDNNYDDTTIEDGNKSNHYWGQVAIFSFVSGGGRGPCLNFGASAATGRILTFCHSDTTLPYCWDRRITNTLEHDGMSDHELSTLKIARANSCAFPFGIDTSREGLSMPFESSSTRAYYYPPGIRAVEITANLRTHFYSLPYGDQVLSLHACTFDFLGGFPDQCLMEDYELVSLLRRRAALFVPPPSDGDDGDVIVGGGVVTRKEKLAIIPGAPALCSPRRWQKFGVLYVTFMNSRFVNLYAGMRKMGPDELFHLYYGRSPPSRDAKNSLWEVELANILGG